MAWDVSPHANIDAIIVCYALKCDGTQGIEESCGSSRE